MFKLVVLFISLTLISCTPARYPQTKYGSRHIPENAASSGSYYSVKKGDSLWRISKKYNVSVEELLKENKSLLPTNLKVGQKIYIPYRHVSTVDKYASFVWPVNGTIVNYFGDTVENSINNGLNIKADEYSQRVKAATSGEAIFSNFLKGWGKAIILRHNSNFYTVYANLEETLIEEGSFAEKEQFIGKIASGKNGDFILHFEIRENYIPQNPLKYLN